MSDLVAVVLRLVSVILFTKSLLMLVHLVIILTGLKPEEPESLSYATAYSSALFLTTLCLSLILWKFATRISDLINKGEGIPTPSMNYLMVGSILIGLFLWVNSLPILLNGIFISKAYDLVLRDIDMLTRLVFGGLLIFFSRFIPAKLVPLVQAQENVSGETLFLRASITLLGLYIISHNLPYLLDRMLLIHQAEFSIWHLEDQMMGTVTGVLLLFAVPITNLLGRPIVMRSAKSPEQGTE